MKLLKKIVKTIWGKEAVKKIEKEELKIYTRYVISKYQKTLRKLSYE